MLNKFLLIGLSLSLFGIELAQAAPATVRCPVVADLQSGTFTKSKKKYRCFRSARGATLSGFSRFDINSIGTNNLPTPTPTVAPPPIPPAPVPDLKSFSMSGTGSAASQVFTITSLPAVISYSAQGNTFDRINIYLRDRGTGNILNTVGYGSHALNNAYVVTRKGTFFIEIKASDTMNWALTVSYR